MRPVPGGTCVYTRYDISSVMSLPAPGVRALARDRVLHAGNWAGSGAVVAGSWVVAAGSWVLAAGSCPVAAAAGLGWAGLPSPT